MTRLVLVIALCGCSSHGPTVDHPQPSRVDAGTSPVAAAAPSEAECNALFDHAIALHSDASESAEDRAKLRNDMSGELPRCRQMTRERYACAMGAATVDAFTACDSR